MFCNEDQNDEMSRFSADTALCSICDAEKKFLHVCKCEKVFCCPEGCLPSVRFKHLKECTKSPTPLLESRGLAMSWSGRFLPLPPNLLDVTEFIMVKDNSYDDAIRVINLLLNNLENKAPCFIQYEDETGLSYNSVSISLNRHGHYQKKKIFRPKKEFFDNYPTMRQWIKSWWFMYQITEGGYSITKKFARDLDNGKINFNKLLYIRSIILEQDNIERFLHPPKIREKEEKKKPTKNKKSESIYQKTKNTKDKYRYVNKREMSNDSSDEIDDEIEHRDTIIDFTSNDDSDFAKAIRLYKKSFNPYWYLVFTTYELICGNLEYEGAHLSDKLSKICYFRKEEPLCKCRIQMYVNQLIRAGPISEPYHDIILMVLDFLEYKEVSKYYQEGLSIIKEAEASKKGVDVINQHRQSRAFTVDELMVSARKKKEKADAKKADAKKKGADVSKTDITQKQAETTAKMNATKSKVLDLLKKYENSFVKND